MNIAPPPSSQDFGFYNRYIFKVKQPDLINALKDNWRDLQKLYNNLSPEMLQYRYDTGKWNMKEIIQHLIDAERNFCYRSMRISRKDTTPIPIYDMDSFIANAHVDSRDIGSLMKELELVRSLTINMFDGMYPAMLEQTGPARDVTVSVRAMGFAIVGHVMHHMDIIKERYLTAFNTISGE
ncbi:MAG: DinB family protein [Bacteroidota bacterium]